MSLLDRFILASFSSSYFVLPICSGIISEEDGKRSVVYTEICDYYLNAEIYPMDNDVDIVNRLAYYDHPELLRKFPTSNLDLKYVLTKTMLAYYQRYHAIETEVSNLEDEEIEVPTIRMSPRRSS